MRLRDWDRNLKVRLYGEALLNLLFWMFFPFIAIYFAEEFGKAVAGILLVLAQVLGVFANLIGGYCADRFGRKRMMVIAAVTEVVGFSLFAFASSPWLHSPLLSFVSFTLLGVAHSFYWPASHAMVADVVAEKDRSSVFAVFYTALNLSVVIGPLLGSVLFFQYRFELLLGSIGASVLLALLVIFLIKETVPRRVQSNEEEPIKALRWYEAIGAQLKDYRIIFHDRVFLLFILAGVLIAQIFIQLDLLIAIAVTDNAGTQTLLAIGSWTLSLGSEQIFSLILAENGLLIALFTVTVTKRVTGLRERNVFMSSAFAYGVSMLLFALSMNIWVLIVAIMVFTIGEIIIAGLQESFISKLAPEHMRGQYFAAASLRFTLGRTIAPFIIPLSAWIGDRESFVVLALISLGGMMLYAVMFQAWEKRGDTVVTAISKGKKQVS
ncbi:MFS transporter [Mechercharimyces sp. CAU 1602]|uniref:MDR family MFS transporter n=1 Tax=Mechercharimyces sp. CAU 1602 TaxID=2973933 RepID=UPI00216250FF|nr:MFS transporter [Mechercharimyces sp. CAU 1602]MCS1351268.1 MFS transporter [Mechercharimyces sp. CAU 1602]